MSSKRRVKVCRPKFVTSGLVWMKINLAACYEDSDRILSHCRFQTRNEHNSYIYIVKEETTHVDVENYKKHLGSPMLREHENEMNRIYVK